LGYIFFFEDLLGFFFLSSGVFESFGNVASFFAVNDCFGRIRVLAAPAEKNLLSLFTVVGFFVAGFSGMISGTVETGMGDAFDLSTLLSNESKL
jgi:hypothetical protein